MRLFRSPALTRIRLHAHFFKDSAAYKIKPRTLRREGRKFVLEDEEVAFPLFLGGNPLHVTVLR